MAMGRRAGCRTIGSASKRHLTALPETVPSGNGVRCGPVNPMATARRRRAVCWPRFGFGGGPGGPPKKKGAPRRRLARKSRLPALFQSGGLHPSGRIGEDPGAIPHLFLLTPGGGWGAGHLEVFGMTGPTPMGNRRARLHPRDGSGWRSPRRLDVWLARPTPHPQPRQRPRHSCWSGARLCRACGHPIVFTCWWRGGRAMWRIRCGPAWPATPRLGAPSADSMTSAAMAGLARAIPRLLRSHHRHPTWCWPGWYSHAWCFAHAGPWPEPGVTAEAALLPTP